MGQLASAHVSSATRRSAVIERSTRFSSESRVCSSIIDAILIALPSVVESNWKSIAHTTFGRLQPGAAHRDASRTRYAHLVTGHAPAEVSH
jgi:hypothetical protein